MKLARLLHGLAVGAALTGLPACSATTQPSTRPAAVESDPNSATIQPRTPPAQAASASGDAALIQRIGDAMTPSDAVAAYGAAAASKADPRVAEQAYVRRMVEFGLPEMAEVQADDLTRRTPDDGLAWAVSAFMSARRGSNDAALNQIAAAAEHAPTDAFVLRTAGQLLAWYDTRADRGALSDTARYSAVAVRARLRDVPGYDRAYRAALDEYARMMQDQALASDAAAPPATQNGALPATVPSTQTGQTYAPVPMPSALPPESYSTPSPYYYGGSEYYDTGVTPYYYTNPYAYDGCAYPYEPWWPWAYYGWWWGPTIIIDHCDFEHHHHHGFDSHDFIHDDFRHHHDDFLHPRHGPGDHHQGMRDGPMSVRPGPGMPLPVRPSPRIAAPHRGFHGMPSHPAGPAPVPPGIGPAVAAPMPPAPGRGGIAR